MMNRLSAISTIDDTGDRGKNTKAAGRTLGEGIARKGWYGRPGLTR